MTTLFDRNGKERNADGFNEKGRPFYRFSHSCSRCGGAGGAEKWAHTGWTCYQCGGSGKGPSGTRPLYDAAALAALVARADRKAAAQAAKRAAENAAETAARDARRAQFLADNADTLGKLDICIADDTGSFWQGFKDDIINRANELSERQVAVVDEAHARCMAARAEKAAAHHVGEEGKRMRGVKGSVVLSKHILTVSRFPRIERFLVKIKTDDGADLVWFTGAGVALGECVVDFTVKGHDIYKDTPQTVVQRVAFK